MSKVSKFPASDNGSQPTQTSEQKIQKETIMGFLKAYGFTKNLSETEQNQFIQIALAGNLDPFKREIHIAVYGEGENRKVSILTGYQVYLKRAERTGKLDGWRAWLEGSGSEMKAIVEIFRKDWSHSFRHEVYWEEAVQKKKDGSPTQFWVKQPRFQLRKVAVAQGFRLAFPDELGGLPYEETAELQDNGTAHENMAQSPANFVKTSIPDSVSDLASKALEDEPPTATSDDNSSEDDFLEKAVKHIENIFENHPTDFTAKHQAWILDKVYKADNNAGIEKMIAYTEKVVKKALSA